MYKANDSFLHHPMDSMENENENQNQNDDILFDIDDNFPMKLDTSSRSDTGSGSSGNGNATTIYPDIFDMMTFDNNRIRDIYVESNSPLSLSENNSDDDLYRHNNDSDSESNNETIQLVVDEMRLDEIYPYSFHEKEREKDEKNREKDREKRSVSEKGRDKKRKNASTPYYFDILEKYYEYNDNYSNNLDILITYTRCQKSIFLKSGYITEVRSFLLVLPTIVIGIIISIFAPEMTRYAQKDLNIISALNIVMTALISISNYLKLESKAEMFKQLYKQYEKLELSLEMTNNKLLYIDNQHDKNQLVLHKLNDIEIKINEMMEINNVTIPNVIKTSFPIICNINVFSLLKKLENYKKSLHHKFFNIKNEINLILYKWKKGELENKLDIEKEKQQKRLLFLYEMKKQLKTEIVQFNEVYSYIDDYFSKEIAIVDNMSHFYILFCGWFSYTKAQAKSYHMDLDHLKDEKKMIVDKYFRIVLDESF